MLRDKQGKYFVAIFYLIIRRRIKMPNVVQFVKIQHF